MLQEADEAEEEGSKGLATKLRATANNEYLYPSQEFLDRTSFGFNDWNDDTAEQWDEIFNSILYG
jgi:hypothetical protein